MKKSKMIRGAGFEASGPGGSLIKIVPAALEHSADIAEIEKFCFSQPWSAQSIQNKIADQNALFLAAFDGEILCGYVSGNISFETIFINNVAVREDYRGRGVGRMLLSWFEEKARTLGIRELTLETRVSNIRALKLYEGLNYIILGKRSGFYSFPTEDAYIMKKDLEAKHHQQ